MRANTGTKCSATSIRASANSHRARWRRRYRGLCFRVRTLEAGLGG